MSSSSPPAITSAVAIFVALSAFAFGCAAPRPAAVPVKTVRIDGNEARVACHCDGDTPEDDDDDDDAPPPRPPVQYVTMNEWQPPASVRRVESEIQMREPGESGAIAFPKLSLHQPIGETTVRPVGRYWGGARSAYRQR